MNSQREPEQTRHTAVQQWLLRVLLCVPAFWLLLHFSFVVRASAANLWPPGGSGYGVGTWFREFPLHMNAFFGTTDVLKTLPILPLVFLATRGSRLRWLLVLAVAPAQWLLYSWLRTNQQLIAFALLQVACVVWIRFEKRRQSLQPQFWLALQCVICAWILPYAVSSYDVVAH